MTLDTTTSLTILALALAAGVALGVLHFGSLWWVVRGLPARARPGRWLLASTAIRFAVTLALFLAVLRAGWPALLACLAGFVVARTVLVAVARSGPGSEAA